MVSWKDLYAGKITTAQQALSKIRPGARIFIGTGCGQPQTLVKELVSEHNNIVDVEIYHLLTQGEAPYIGEEQGKKFRTFSFFLAPNVREPTHHVAKLVPPRSRPVEHKRRKPPYEAQAVVVQLATQLL